MRARDAGEMLAEMEKAKGAARPTRSHDATTLEGLDINYNQSSRWQAIARIPRDAGREAEGEESALAVP